MMSLPDAVLDQLLAEDVPYGDLTTHALGIGDANGIMDFTARDPMVACCVEEATRLIERAGGKAKLLVKSGDVLPVGTPILTASGPASRLLIAWKVAQTLVEATSGIATATRAIVDAAKRGGEAVVACTRKTFPGTKNFALKAVLAGGGTPHRLGLSDSILLFPEHRIFLSRDIAAHIERLKRHCPEKKVVAEASDPYEAQYLAQAGVDVLQLEKFTLPQVAQIREFLNTLSTPPLLAVAGGVNAANAQAYVEAGARILVTSSPYWAKPTDVQVTIQPRILATSDHMPAY